MADNGSSASLRNRALRLMTSREHSRFELTRKLAPHAESQEQIVLLLDDLERSGLLSQERFAQSLAYRRASRFGLRRIEHELRTHHLEAPIADPLIDSLRGTERERALSVWNKRFGRPAIDRLERARQQRFLAQRGFGGDTITWVMRQAAETAQSDPSENASGSDDSI